MENRLKPMSIRDILDVTFAIMRERFWMFQIMIFKAFFLSMVIFSGMILVSLAYLFIISSIIKIPLMNAEFWTTFFQKTIISSMIMIVFLFLLLLAFIVTLIIGGINFTYGSVMLYKTGLHREPCSSQEIFSGIKGKRLKIFLVQFIIIIFMYVIMIPGMIASVVVTIINQTAGQIVSYLNNIPIYVFQLFVCLAPIVAVTEDLDVIKTITRAFNLPAKHRWRVLWTLVLVYLLSCVIYLIFMGLFVFAIVMAIGMKTIVGYCLAGIMILAVVFLIMVFMTFGFGPLVAIYYDLIIRKEGYDLRLKMAAGETAPDSVNSGWSLNN